MKQTGNVILITGGGSGIGRALAHRWHDSGNRVIITGRNHEKLNYTVAGKPGISTIDLDVTDPAAIRNFAQELMKQHPEVNILVNNAGVMNREDVTSGRDLGAAEATVATNLLGPIRLTNSLIDHLTAKANSVIINVTSGLAFVPLPSTPTYSATKAAMHSYSIALREQLRGKVEVIEMVPPAVQTELTPGQSTREGYMPLEEYVDEVMALFNQVPTPEEILVERVLPLRLAEANGRFDEMLTMLKAV